MIGESGARKKMIEETDSEKQGKGFKFISLLFSKRIYGAFGSLVFSWVFVVSVVTLFQYGWLGFLNGTVFAPVMLQLAGALGITALGGIAMPILAAVVAVAALWLAILSFEYAANDTVMSNVIFAPWNRAKPVVFDMSFKELPRLFRHKNQILTLIEFATTVINPFFWVDRLISETALWLENKMVLDNHEEALGLHHRIGLTVVHSVSMLLTVPVKALSLVWQVAVLLLASPLAAAYLAYKAVEFIVKAVKRSWNRMRGNNHPEFGSLEDVDSIEEGFPIQQPKEASKKQNLKETGVKYLITRVEGNIVKQPIYLTDDKKIAEDLKKQYEGKYNSDSGVTFQLDECAPDGQSRGNQVPYKIGVDERDKSQIVGIIFGRGFTIPNHTFHDAGKRKGHTNQPVFQPTKETRYTLEKQNGFKYGFYKTFYEASNSSFQLRETRGVRVTKKRVLSDNNKYKKPIGQLVAIWNEGSSDPDNPAWRAIYRKPKQGQGDRYEEKNSSIRSKPSLEVESLKL